MKGVTLVFAPLGAELGFAAGEDGFTLVYDRMNIAARRTGLDDVADFDDVRRAQLACTTFLAQGVVGGMEILVDAEVAGSDVLGVGLGSVGAGVGGGVGTVRSRVGLRRSRVGWGGGGRTRMVGFGRNRVFIMHCIYIHVYGV